jgi:Bacterial Ig-like domain (group 3)
MRVCALPRRFAAVCVTAIAVVIVSCVTVPVGWAQGFGGVLTYHNDIGRTGQNPNETILTPKNVNLSNFGKLFAYPLDGSVFAQPLYVPAVTIPGQGLHNVLYVVTENDGVYAFDADGLTVAPLWYVSLVNPALGITAVPCAQMAQSCNVYPIDGITGTPVIDPVTQTIYFVAQTLESGAYFQRLHALDITTGAEKFGGPTIIQGSVHNSKGTLLFDPQHNLPRPGLLLLNNIVYLAWAGSTHGWMMSYDASTLQQLAIICTTPNGDLGGLWASGGGIVSDGTDVFVEAGDGTFDLDSGGKDFADSIVKLDPNTLAVLDYFTPMDQSCRRLNDMDLGSGGPMLLSNQPGPYPNEIVVSGKGGNPCDSFGNPPVWNSLVYLVDKDNLGHYNALGPDPDIQTIEGAPFGYHSSPAYFHGATASYVYLAGLTSEGGTGDTLKQFTLSNGLLSTTPTAQTSFNFVVGATPAVSSNGTTNGILWAQERQDILSSVSNIKPSILYAFDATNVGTMFYSSTQAGNRDQAGPATKFVTPTIANGKVYLATLTELDVYGLLAGQSATTTVMSTNPNPVYGSPVTLTATVTSNGGSPKGSVNFYLKNGTNLVGVAPLVGDQASIQINGLSVGAHTYDATYDGTGSFAVSSAVLTFSVNKAPTSTVINSSSLNPSTYGQPVTFTATVTSSAGAGTPTGTITFQKGGAVLGSGTVSGSGVASYTTTPTQLTGGTDSIIAVYNPDQNHAKSTSPTFSQIVKPEASSTAFTSSPNPSKVGVLVTLTATVTATVGTPTGNVVFKNGTTTLGTKPLVNGTATMTYTFTTTGSFSLKAGYQGSVNNSPSSNTLTQVVNP